MPHDPQHFTENMEKAAQLWPEIIALLMQAYPQPKAAEQRIATHITDAFLTYYRELLHKEPSDLLGWQMDWWQRSTHLWQQQWHQFIESPTTNAEGIATKAAKDRRFRNELWEKNWFFDSLRKQYLLNAEIVEEAVRDTGETLDPHTAHLVNFYSKQWIDALSPGNFPWSNPEVLKSTLDSDGNNLVQGMQNLLADLRAGRISMTQSDAFTLGKNIATTPGSIVFENAMFQLIQYAPSTAEVFETPLLIIPAWINKYYILDLQPENSMVKWLTDQGFTVFVVSWVNPNESHRDKGFDDYLVDGAYAAVKKVQEATGQSSIHLAGYCLGGTLSACLLSWLASRKESSRIATATFLTTLVDFSEAGDLRVFIDEPQIAAMEERMAKNGYLEGREMATTFNLLRPTDLIWSFVINNYLLGKAPFPFDLLYWNMDATRMPAKMHSFYLRQMYLNNNLVIPGKLVIGGEKIDLTTITTPAYLLSTREDHIAPWVSAYAATQQYRGEITFVLAESGHIAGVINPPGKGKYGYWTNSQLPARAEDWLADAEKQSCSWWPHWMEWVKSYSATKVKARIPGEGKLKVIEPTPGRYAKVKL